MATKKAAKKVATKSAPKKKVGRPASDPAGACNYPISMRIPEVIGAWLEREAKRNNRTTYDQLRYVLRMKYERSK